MVSGATTCIVFYFLLWLWHQSGQVRLGSAAVTNDLEKLMAGSYPLNRLLAMALVCVIFISGPRVTSQLLSGVWLYAMSGAREHGESSHTHS